MSLSERLGYGSDARLLIVHADDAGMCLSVNRATQAALESGAVTSASIMFPCPWAADMAQRCREHPEWDCGVHLTLTSEWRTYRWGPVSDRSAVPGLVDDDGFMWRDVRDVAARASADEVERESRAQIERALAWGVRITHIDSHMGTLFARPDYFEVYYRLALEYGVPAMIPYPTPATIQRFRDDGYPRIDELVALASSGKLPAIDYLAPGPRVSERTQRTGAYQQQIRDLPQGVSQIIVHLGSDDEELRAITSSWESRVNDAAAFEDPATRCLISAERIRLIAWRDLMPLVSP
ncbi:ChbG/HpnK family deacetylase [Candidatus Poribacteria bacterium]|nr:ChbG/HpnK family deacetylase [Candidatus Poribacteria bacterium]